MMSPKIVQWWDRWQLWVAVGTVIAGGATAYSQLTIGQKQISEQVFEIKTDRARTLQDWSTWRVEVDKSRNVSAEWRVAVDAKLDRILNRLEK